MEPQESYYMHCLQQIDWSGIVQAIKNDTDEGYISTVKQVVDLSVDFLLVEPRTKPDLTCQAPALVLDCKAHGAAFTGQRSQPVKMAHMIQLGFDVDSLEIHLNEIYDVVDRIFIIESSKSHFKGISKPLIWGILVQSVRFRKFKEKCVHFVIDDAEGLKGPNKDDGIWAIEKYTESIRYKR